ncbi:flavin-containing monooxygenase 5-like [Oppia nitens]|uniref:flavin-containing monooxygenase 5-like n=1 Tax=Oppia nitens TaxID=1686743 RepID=UPI0023DC0521|nr:flavin-containing monooxygenase 5-like [Oppia nitens]
MSDKIKIAIIGAGASGATACKACLEEGFDVVVYERTTYTGGLWRYREDVVDGVASVAKSTIINSSKEMSAFSDFPPPADFPNYMHNTKMVKYFDLYGETFGYEKYVKFRHEVIRLEPNGDYESTGRWKLTVRDNNITNGQVFSEVFDGVMVCTGHHVQPLVPTFRDQHLFGGQILHTHSYRKPDAYHNKRVVVVGIGNSGGDAAVELSSVAEQVYLSTRRGSWITYRVGPNGKPSDSWFLRRYTNFLMNYMPYWLVCSIYEWYANSRFDHKDYQLKPYHRILSQHIMVNDSLPDRILSGTVTVKCDIDRFTKTGVIFKGDSSETPCDVVLLATGYRVSFPFISPKLIPIDKNHVELYKYVFPARLSHPKTLAFISLAQPIGALLPIGELQSRWFAQLMANKQLLPSRDAMFTDIDKKRQFMKRFYRSDRHTIQVDWINFMDELAAEVGVRPQIVKYLFTDPVLWLTLVFGPSVPYQYRLEGPHSWPGARNAIMTVPQRIGAPLKTRQSNLHFS